MSPNLHYLGEVIEAEADFFVSLDLVEARGGSSDGISRSSTGIVGVNDHTGHLDGEVGGFGEGETLCLTGVGDGEVGL